MMAYIYMYTLVSSTRARQAPKTVQAKFCFSFLRDRNYAFLTTIDPHSNA